MTGDLWEVLTLPGSLSLELRGGDKPGVVLVQDSERVREELGDTQALLDGGRRVIRFHLGGDAAAGLRRLAEHDV